ncbi:MAG TPA: hypothetical protein VN898_05840 [Candidatus Binatia bacterium]|nr:hypothetical protein [Candidatus Binatia bacterium]
MLLLAGILITLAAVAFILSPFARHAAAPLTDGPDLAAELRELMALKAVAYETLQDIEFDYHAGKIGALDYQEMTDRYTREAVDLMHRIEAIEGRLPALRGEAPGRR